MKRVALATVFMLGICWGHTAASGEPPVTVRPENLLWFRAPNNPALQGAWVLGAEQKPGPYMLRVKLAAGGRIPPHTHPDERNSTVLSGTMYVGFGEVFDESNLFAVPTGGVYVAPANIPHYLWAKNGEVVYQEAGVGPTATVPIKR
jgi:quercetin dioxygenase-like cupin family protein